MSSTSTHANGGQRKRPTPEGGKSSTPQDPALKKTTAIGNGKDPVSIRSFRIDIDPESEMGKQMAAERKRLAIESNERARVTNEFHKATAHIPSHLVSRSQEAKEFLETRKEEKKFQYKSVSMTRGRGGFRPSISSTPFIRTNPYSVTTKLLLLQATPYSEKEHKKSTKTGGITYSFEIRAMVTGDILRVPANTTSAVARACSDGSIELKIHVDLSPKAPRGVPSINGHWYKFFPGQSLRITGLVSEESDAIKIGSMIPLKQISVKGLSAREYDPTHLPSIGVTKVVPIETDAMPFESFVKTVPLDLVYFDAINEAPPITDVVDDNDAPASVADSSQQLANAAQEGGSMGGPSSGDKIVVAAPGKQLTADEVMNNGRILALRATPGQSSATPAAAGANGTPGATPTKVLTEAQKKAKYNALNEWHKTLSPLANMMIRSCIPLQMYNTPEYLIDQQPFEKGAIQYDTEFDPKFHFSVQEGPKKGLTTAQLAYQAKVLQWDEKHGTNKDQAVEVFVSAATGAKDSDKLPYLIGVPTVNDWIVMAPQHITGMKINAVGGVDSARSSQYPPNPETMYGASIGTAVWANYFVSNLVHYLSTEGGGWRVSRKAACHLVYEFYRHKVDPVTKVASGYKNCQKGKNFSLCRELSEDDPIQGPLRTSIVNLDAYLRIYQGGIINMLYSSDSVLIDLSNDKKATDEDEDQSQADDDQPAEVEPEYYVLTSWGPMQQHHRETLLQEFGELEDPEAAMMDFVSNMFLFPVKNKENIERLLPDVAQHLFNTTPPPCMMPFMVPGTALEKAKQYKAAEEEMEQAYLEKMEREELEREQNGGGEGEEGENGQQQEENQEQQYEEGEEQQQEGEGEEEQQEGENEGTNEDQEEEQQPEGEEENNGNGEEDVEMEQQEDEPPVVAPQRKLKSATNNPRHHKKK